MSIVNCIFGFFHHLSDTILDALGAKKRYTSFVMEHSQAIQELNKLNNEYVFCDISKHTQNHIYDNKDFYDSISCQDYLIYQLQFISKETLQQINKVNLNKKNYKDYCERLSNIKCFECFDVATDTYNQESLASIEKQIFEQNIKHPDVEYFINVALYCSQINGRVYQGKTAYFSSEDIQTLIKRLNNKTGNFYNDREIWDAICRVERGKVSNKMRFAIYQRDGYRCRICGRTNRFDDLEIDHIKPIAKGGKSTPDNLQTLCKRCNKEKGDTYYVRRIGM